MFVFATPDFGAAGGIACVLFIVWAIVLLVVMLGVAAGMRRVNSDSSQKRRTGVILLLASCLLPVACCLGPPQVFRLNYGSYPLGSYPDGKIQKGMTAEEVIAVLGEPHDRFKGDDDERWYYWLDSFGMGWFGVHFGPDGRVQSTYGN
jgi:hypothetical protein